MEFIQVIYKCAFVLALIVSYEIVSIQGRQLRPKNKQDLNKLTSSGTGAEQEHGVRAFRPTPTTPGKGGNSPPTTTKTHNQQVGSSDDESRNSGAEVHKDAFRPAPTTPGKGHGIGHSNEQVAVEAQGQNSNGRHYVAGDKEDFRPTTPGHSPGAGHGTGKN
ncbi:precursor of CEP9-like [Ziziphus jujuba]|uniref:Precursor of CEP9-like n=1 Tax=Ziziphus jujuba TaxID=326968 RepID=A0ABM4ADQ0_ZIZJJ|nr:precursor of CEP9-like [Ziziphus jujuba]